MVKYPTETVMCTNGIAIKRRLDSLLRISENLTILFSIEGLEKEHDNLRGKNSFSRTMENMQLLLDLQKQDLYKGKISVATVVSDEMIPNMVPFCELMEEKGINTLFINFPWYIPKQVAQEVDNYFIKNFEWMNTFDEGRNTWHSFDYHIDEKLIDEILIHMEEIRNRNWNIRIRFRPQLKDDEIRNFIKGLPVPYKDKQLCLGISSRVDIMPDGKVVPCKKFPEFVVGNLNDASLLELWKGEQYERFRKISNNCLNPLCLKCEILEMAGI
jgi:radical SAM protein with 4Fe4S-binding SPASM domain